MDEYCLSVAVKQTYIFRNKILPKIYNCGDEIMFSDNVSHGHG